MEAFFLNSIENNTKKAWDENWKPHEVERLLEIFNYPRVKKQMDLYLRYLPKKEKILEEKKILPELPEDLTALIKKAISVRKHAIKELGGD